MNRAALGAMTLAGLAGCGLFERATTDYAPPGARGEKWSAVQAEEVREVHRLLALGDVETARAWLARLRQRAPDDLGLTFLHQDVEIAAGREAQVREAARALADAEPEPAHLLAAARVEDDPAAARAWIERALELSPGDPWAHYALAHREARNGSWVEAGRLL
ncbi:MAG TPA: hypothetical protein VMT18_04895, partial [Planctomycetota bacterium]|nr:hypothetical protein [Planctomycetota bacterium]